MREKSEQTEQRVHHRHRRPPPAWWGILVQAEGAIDFRHELIGRAVEADVLPFQQSRHHAAIAIGLERFPLAAAHR